MAGSGRCATSKKRNKLSRDAGHRKALIMNLCTEIVDHERIQTTEAKAKVVKPEVEKLITLAKRGDLHARRQALSALGQNKFTVHKLFEEIAPRYSERHGRIHAHPQARAASVGRDRDGLHRTGLGGRCRRHGTLSHSGVTLKLTLEYDGRGFSGWAAQPGLRTVEGELGAALQTVLGRGRSCRSPAAPTPACTPGARWRASTRRRRCRAGLRSRAR